MNILKERDNNNNATGVKTPSEVDTGIQGVLREMCDVKTCISLFL
jgi:hypothetical protein